MSYEILEHTADAKFRATGESLEEAFEEAVSAFSDITGGLGGNVRHQVKIESESHEALLFDFLDELIYLQDYEDVVISHAEKVDIEEDIENGHRLEAVVWADPIVDGMSPLDVKGPTYNEMKVEFEQGEKWMIEAVLDI